MMVIYLYIIITMVRLIKGNYKIVNITLTTHPSVIV